MELDFFEFSLFKNEWKCEHLMADGHIWQCVSITTGKYMILIKKFNEDKLKK